MEICNWRIFNYHLIIWQIVRFKEPGILIAKWRRPPLLQMFKTMKRGFMAVNYRYNLWPLNSKHIGYAISGSATKFVCAYRRTWRQGREPLFASVPKSRYIVRLDGGCHSRDSFITNTHWASIKWLMYQHDTPELYTGFGHLCRIRTYLNFATITAYLPILDTSHKL